MSCFSNQLSSSGETEDEFKFCDSFWLILSRHLLTPHQVLSKVPYNLFDSISQGLAV